VGTARSKGISEAGFKENAYDAVAEFGTAKPTGEAWRTFEDALSFGTADLDDPSPLVSAVRAAERQIGGHPQRLFHLAIPPTAFGWVIEMLGASGLAQGARAIIEKPFGTDLASARALNESVHRVFDQSQLFRIDHFLGKESVDNILALRFANGLFEMDAPPTEHAHRHRRVGFVAAKGSPGLLPSRCETTSIAANSAVASRSCS
jgi:glucose-6-phosphate 1-dehydrogenase